MLNFWDKNFNKVMFTPKWMNIFSAAKIINN